MTDTRTITALALALALLGADVAIASTTGAEDWRDLGPRGVAARGGCAATPSLVADVEDPEPARVIGQVVALDARSGVAMLATERGVLALQGTPETLGQLGVGDVVVVELVDEEEPRHTPAGTSCL